MDNGLPTLRPYRVAPNPVRRAHYKQGSLIEVFRSRQDPSPAAEDWTTSDVRPRTATPDSVDGLGRVFDGDGRFRYLAEIVTEHPEIMLGTAHLHRWGVRMGVLAKLLDPDRRIPVHCHPTGEFARRHLPTNNTGKAEAWLVLRTRGTGDNAWIGFRDELSPQQLNALIGTQNDSIIEALNPVRLEAGDLLFVPPGVPHSLGPDILVLEPQEPSDWSVLAEYTPFGVDAAKAMLGLDPAIAFECFDRSRWTAEKIENELVVRGALRDLAEGFTTLLTVAHDFFVVNAIRALEPLYTTFDGPHTVLTLDGEGTLSANGVTEGYSAGDTFFLPAALPTVAISPREQSTFIAIGAAE
jgi:mannose-6-phosphate isomerase